MFKKISKKNRCTAIFVAVSLLGTAMFTIYYTGPSPEVKSDNAQLILGELTSVPNYLLAQAEREARQPEQKMDLELQAQQEEAQELKTQVEPIQQEPPPVDNKATPEPEAARQSAPKAESEPAAQPKDEPAPKPEPKVDPTPEPEPEPQPSPSGLPQAEKEMLDLVNAERTSRGLQPLKAAGELTEVGRMHSQDMADNNFFDHVSPTYGSLTERLKMFNISYRAAGENLAKAGSVEGAHNALMDSDGHRANILNGNFTHVGIGIVKSGTRLLITQIFIRY
jgi:uncharacterized YkwD family protein